MLAVAHRERHVQRRAGPRPDVLVGGVGKRLRPLRHRGQHGRADPRRRGARPGRSTQDARARPLVHVPARPQVPLVPAGLPVLQPLHVRGHRRRVHAVLGQQRRHLGERGVLELVQPRGQQVVDRLRGLLRGQVQEALEHQHPVGQLALVEHLALVGEQVVAQVHAVGEGVAQHPHRPGRGDAGRHLGADRVLDQVRRPGRAADLAAHLDVLDRVGHPPLVDVRELPQRLVEQVPRALHEPAPPVRRVRRHGARPQVGEPALDRVLRHRPRSRPSDRHERGQPGQVLARAGQVAGALEQLEEVVVEVEDPDVPVGDQVQVRPGRVGVGVGAQQRVVVGVEVVGCPRSACRAAARRSCPSPAPRPCCARGPARGSGSAWPGRACRTREARTAACFEATKGARRWPRSARRLHTIEAGDRPTSAGPGHGSGHEKGPHAPDRARLSLLPSGPGEVHEMNAA